MAKAKSRKQPPAKTTAQRTLRSSSTRITANNNNGSSTPVLAPPVKLTLKLSKSGSGDTITSTTTTSSIYSNNLPAASLKKQAKTVKHKKSSLNDFDGDLTVDSEDKNESISYSGPEESVNHEEEVSGLVEDEEDIAIDVDSYDDNEYLEEDAGVPDFDELMKVKGPKTHIPASGRLTSRQKALLQEEHNLESDTEIKIEQSHPNHGLGKRVFSEEQLLAKAEESRRRKHQREQQLEESRQATISRLLAKNSGSAAGSTSNLSTSTDVYTSSSVIIRKFDKRTTTKNGEEDLGKASKDALRAFIEAPPTPQTITRMHMLPDGSSYYTFRV